ncbi:MAG: V-type ATP synthase subunit D [Chlamydiales bacterium]|nr:V-type ATP synthase subunit D [Chlamydiales bacterium]
MAQIRLTKSELRLQQVKLLQLSKYLPTLQLKKAMLQIEVNNANIEIVSLEDTYEKMKGNISLFARLLTAYSLDEFFDNLRIETTVLDYENIAGVEIPILNHVKFVSTNYSYFVTPLWWDSAIKLMRELLVQKQKIAIAIQKRDLLQKELRDVSIRVNLFEKILIPRTEANIKKIKVFLGDQQLSAVAQAKVAKEKIILKKDAEVS